MKKTAINQSAKRLFDAYFRHVDSSSLDELYTIIGEACRLHNRLRIYSRGKKGLYNLDEFLLLKALRNYSEHSGDFFGEAYTYDPKIITPKLMIYHIKLHRLCLVRKDEVKRAINSEKPLSDPTKEQAKVEAVNSQLISYGDYYDLEPVVFNFIAKLYELLQPLNLSISGEAYTSMQHSYEEEARSDISHYVPVTPIPFDNEVLMENLVPLDSGVNEAKDEFGDIATTGINYTGYTLRQTDGLPGSESLLYVDEVMAMDLIVRDPNFVDRVSCLPHHIGAAVILDDEMKDIDVKPFDIKQELAGLQQHAIEIDEKLLPTHDEEVFVLVCVSGKESSITPNLIFKDTLISYYRDVRPDTQDKVGYQKKIPSIKKSSKANDKKKKRKAAAKARKKQRK
jgi:hypothetical protein